MDLSIAFFCSLLFIHSLGFCMQVEALCCAIAV